MNLIKSLEGEFSEYRYKGDRNDPKKPVLITKEVRNISKKYFNETKNMDKESIFNICEEMLDTKKWEFWILGFDWAFKIRKKYKCEDFFRFSEWIDKYVKGWDSCDDFCTHAFGYFLYKFPEFFKETYKWTENKNMWYRRAASVVLIYPIKNEILINEGFETADKLLTDDEDLVQKGCGWMLKVIANKHQNLVFDYVQKNKKTMKRMILRYAIEKMPLEKKKILMNKNDF